MFVQIIQGQIDDAEAAKQTLDLWLKDLQPGAKGWLGGTYGVTDDGLLVAVVRFESQEHARRNAERPEQGAWWERMKGHFTGEITFRDCNDVALLVGGGSDDATFVQVIQGQVRDVERAHALIEQSGSLISTYRPDVLGATIAIDENGYFTETVAFSSEAAARAAELQPMPVEIQRLMEEEMSLLADARFLDLHHPWFASAKRPV